MPITSRHRSAVGVGISWKGNAAVERLRAKLSKPQRRVPHPLECGSCRRQPHGCRSTGPGSASPKDYCLGSFLLRRSICSHWSQRSLAKQPPHLHVPAMQPDTGGKYDPKREASWKEVQAKPSNFGKSRTVLRHSRRFSRKKSSTMFTIPSHPINSDPFGPIQTSSILSLPSIPPHTAI